MKKQQYRDDEKEVQGDAKRNKIRSIEHAAKPSQKQYLSQRWNSHQQGNLAVRQVQAFLRAQEFNSQGSRRYPSKAKEHPAEQNNCE